MAPAKVCSTDQHIQVVQQTGETILLNKRASHEEKGKSIGQRE